MRRPIVLLRLHRQGHTLEVPLGPGVWLSVNLGADPRTARRRLRAVLRACDWPGRDVRNACAWPGTSRAAFIAWPRRALYPGVQTE